MTLSNPALVILLIMSVVIVSGGCGKSESQASVAPPPPPVNVMVPVEREVQDFDEFTGRVAAVESIDVRSRVSGYIQSVGFKDGDEVKKDQLLFQIDPRPFVAELNQAKAQLGQAKAEEDYAGREFARLEPLAKAGSAAQSELSKARDMVDRAKASIAKANASIERAQLDVDYAAVKSPIDGRISTTTLSVGNLVAGDTLLTSVVSISPIYVNIDVDERRMLFYQEEARKKGQPNPKSIRDANLPIFVGVADNKEFPHKGVLDFVNNKVDPLTGTIRARGVFDNAERRLTPGQYVQARFPRGAPAKTLLVPDRAIARDQDRNYVLSVNDKNVVEYRSVETGGRFGDERAVTKGLKSGERIVVDGLQRARPGQPVTPTLVEPATTRPAAVATK
jgi:RND family efflux transporter MFP subunit